ncbi:MAG: hypothetical protein ACMUIL_03715, partial [bacterium]
MRKIGVVLCGVILVCFCSCSALAGSYTLQYKVAPGQVWVTTLSTQSETSFMGNKEVNRNKSTIRYEVSKGPNKGWVSLSARIQSQGESSNSGQMDLSKIRFTADMHQSGEIRNIQSEGSAMPPLEGQAGDLPAGMAAMYEQSSKMIADAWKTGVFWFPELPEDPLEPGDEFEVTRKMGMGSSTAGMQMESVSKQVFTLEEVSEGLAYFSVKERSLTQSTAQMGGKSDTRTAGKGEATFDLREGMWTDMTIKSTSNVQFGNIPGMSGGN